MYRCVWLGVAVETESTEKVRSERLAAKVHLLEELRKECERLEVLQRLKLQGAKIVAPCAFGNGCV